MLLLKRVLLIVVFSTALLGPTFPAVAQKQQSSISILVSTQSLVLGQNVAVSGSISPPHYAPVVLNYRRPDETVLNFLLATPHPDGSYIHIFTPDQTGSWSVQARWFGDEDHVEAMSDEISFSVTATVDPRRTLYNSYADAIDPEYWLDNGVSLLKMFGDDFESSFLSPLGILKEFATKLALGPLSSAERLVKEFAAGAGALSFLDTSTVLNFAYSKVFPPFGSYKGSIGAGRTSSDEMRNILTSIEDGDLVGARSRMSDLVSYLENADEQVDSTPSLFSVTKEKVHNILQSTIFFLKAEFVSNVDDGSIVELQESQHKLYLHVRDNHGRHVGLNHTTDVVDLEIPNASYFDSVNLSVIVIPKEISAFTCTVDAKRAQEDQETYSLTLVEIKDKAVVSEATKSGTINKNEIQEYIADVSDSETHLDQPKIERGLIFIDGDESFTLENGVIGGSGTADDPYVIGNWEIGKSTDFGIEIRNTHSVFIIRNSYLHNNNGIFLMSVENGMLENVILEGTMLGQGGAIWLNSSSHVTIQSSDIKNAGDGIRLELSEDITIRNNVISENFDGLFVSNCSSIKVLGNTIHSNTHYGIWLGRYGPIEWVTIEQNDIYMNRHGVVMWGDSKDYTIRHVEVLRNNIFSNKWAGLSYQGGSGIPSNIVVKDNTVYSNEVGIFWIGENSVFEQNYVHDNNDKGIWVKSIPGMTRTRNNTFRHNVIENNFFGVWLGEWSVGETMVYGNRITNSTYGVYLEDACNNTIFHNNFRNNAYHAHPNNTCNPASSNIWNEDWPSGGNYWSDYSADDKFSGQDQSQPGSDGICDVPYAIDNDNIDKYPLMGTFNVFEVSFGLDSKKIPIISNSTISSFQINLTQKKIKFNVKGDSSIGFCRISIPNVVVEGLWQGNYTVFVDRETPLHIRNWTEGVQTHIYFTYQHSTHEVTIVPAYPSLTADFCYSPFPLYAYGTATFSAMTSFSLYGTIASYNWDFGDTDNVTLGMPIATHAYMMPGNYSVTLIITDEFGFRNDTETSLVVLQDDVLPVTDDDYDGIWHNANFTIALTATDLESGVAQTYYRIDNGTVRTISMDGQPYVTTEYGGNMLEYWSVDNAGNEELPHNILTGIKLDMTTPTANAGRNQTVDEDSLMTFDGSSSWDENGIADYKWVFTDVTSKTLSGKNPGYTFVTPGTYVVTLNTTDLAGNWATDIVVLTALDVTKPIANAGQNQTVNAGAIMTFDAGGSTDNVGIVIYEWDFGDGTTETGVTATHIYTSPGTYTVTSTVGDAAGNTATDTATITVLLDNDGDGRPDVTDLDDDNDGVNDDEDTFPLDPTETVDSDGDGIGNNADTDDDNDGMPDAWEMENGFNPHDATDASLDSDNDGIINLQEYQGGTNPSISDLQTFPTWVVGTAVLVISLGTAAVAMILRKRSKRRKLDSMHSYMVGFHACIETINRACVASSLSFHYDFLVWQSRNILPTLCQIALDLI